MKTDNDKLRKEIMEVISDGQHEVSEEKNVVYDKTTKQFSIKIPKSLALKSKLSKDSIFRLAINPKESIKEIESAKLVIYLKEGKNGEGEKAA